MAANVGLASHAMKPTTVISRVLSTIAPSTVRYSCGQRVRTSSIRAMVMIAATAMASDPTRRRTPSHSL